MNLTNLIKIKEGFSENFNLMDNKNIDENDEEQNSSTTIEERNKNNHEKQIIDKIINQFSENDNFENIDNVYSKKETKITKTQEKKLKIEKDDLLGWDL